MWVLYVPTFPLQTSTWGAICSSCYCLVICSIWLPFAAFGSHLHAICSILGAAAPFAAFPTHSLPVRPTTYTLNRSTSLLPTKLPLFYRSLCSDFIYMTTYYLCTTTYRLLTYILHIIYIPVVPHKAVAEVAKIGNLLSERLVVVNHGWQSESLMDRQVVGVVFFRMVEMVAVVPLPQLLDVAWCSAAVVAVVAVVVA